MSRTDAGSPARSPASQAPSIARGIPLSEEPGLGALTIPGYLRQVTARFAEREALISRIRSGNERWTYQMLWDRSVEVARALVACGVGKDTRVGILMTNRPEQLAAAFGTALAGGLIVMLDTFSTSSELEHLLQASGVGILLFERRVVKKDFASVLVELEPAIETAEPGRLRSTRFPFLRRIAMLPPAAEAATPAGIEAWGDFLRRGEATPPALVEATAATVKPADPGALFFSSGTTSLPKGVLHAQRAVAIQWWRWGRLMEMKDPVRSWTANGFFWSGNFSMVIGGTFSSGGTLVLQPTFQPEASLALMQAERVSFALAWPHQWARLEAAPGWNAVDLGSLRYVKDDTPGARHRTVRTAWLSPPSYGSTETLTISTAFSSSTPPHAVAGSHGEPLPGNTLKIVDPESGVVLPRGASGEIAVKGPTLMLGYLGVPRDEVLDEEGFFHSGDRGHLDEAGRLFWEGRLSEVIKTGGANVSPREIDTVLAALPGVKLSQTVGVPHAALGEMVVSCIVLHEGAVLGEAEIREFARERLASYKVPRRFLFFRDEELEMTGSDKVKTDALRRLSVERLGAVRRA
jgi:fatty-acyl-CoA synthase